jgi:Ca2+-binding RTX toxin-like protein
VSRRTGLLALLVLVLGVAALPANAGIDQIVNVGDIDTLATGFGSAYGTAVDSQGNVYVAELNAYKVWKITPDGTKSVFAGIGTSGFTGDGGPATSAELVGPIDVAVDSQDNVYIADRYANRIRMVDQATGYIDTVAGSGDTGNGNGGYTGDDGAATSATLNRPEGVALDGSDVLYIMDTGNQVVRKVDGGTITTLAAVNGYNIAAAADGTVFVSRLSPSYIYKIDTDGTVTTYAGTGTQAYSGDDGPATSAELDRPSFIAVSPAGDLYMITVEDDRIRKIDHTTQYISTVAGDGTEASTGDGGPATAAEIDQASGLGFDAAGNMYFVQYGNGAVRVVAYADTDGDTFPDLVDNFPLIYSNCQGQQATIAGDDTANLLDGTPEADVIVGNGGDDTIDGMGGKDLICAGDGDDTIHGGGGRDTIYGDKGADTIYGDKKSDKLYGGSGPDVIFGNGGGHDSLHGNKGTDTLDGGKGANDECIGGETLAACEIII